MWRFRELLKQRKRHFIVWLKRVTAAGVLGGVAIATALSIPAVSHALIDRLQVFPALNAGELDRAAQGKPAAIVILSAGRRGYAPEFGGETVDALSLERIRYGAEVARHTALPLLVSGGSPGMDDVPLAKLMADVLSRDYGIAAKWQETRSTTTAENAIYSAEILKRAGIDRVVLVTHAWHMKRARDAFVANGISVIPAPTAFYGRERGNVWPGLSPTMQSLRMSGYAIHETVGSAWYALRYGY